MKIFNFDVVDRCLYWKTKKTLIVGDLHLGYEESLTEKGYVLPRNQQKENYEIFERIFRKVKGKIKRIIFLGDIKHYFGKILLQESNDFKNLLNFIDKELGEKPEIIIVKGNHDKILEPIVRDYKNVKLIDFISEDSLLFIHGDSFSVKKNYKKIKDKEIKLIILGHFHPAVVINEKEGVKSEKYKCFLYGFSSEYSHRVIFVPSFFPLVEGSDIKKDLEIYEKGMKIIAISDDGKLYKFRKI
jgi:putative SbcD/Mre11-related phosphoesterase